MVDILIKGGIIYTMSRGRRIIEDGAVTIDGNSIIDVGPTEALEDIYSADMVIDASNSVVLPGFLDVHTHLPSIFVRGVYGVVSEGLYKVLFPVKRYIEPDHIYHFGLASCIEAMNSGITTVQESYNYMDAFAHAAKETGIRAVLGEQISEADYGRVGDGEYVYLPEQAEEMYGRALKLVDDWHGEEDGRITTCLAPLAPDMCTPHVYEQVQKEAEDRKLLITTHLAQSSREVAQVRHLYDKTPVEHLHHLGVLGKELLAAHCIHIDEQDTRLLTETGTRVLHCPRPYILGGTTVPLARWLDEGIRVGLGTDNVYHSMWETMRAALYAARVRAAQGESRDRPTLYELLELVTIGGAETLGMQKDIGSIEPGKRADIQLIDLGDPHLTPTVDISSSLVLYGSTASVKTVIVNGKLVKESGAFTDIDVHRCLSKAQELSDQVWDELFSDQPSLRELVR